MELTQSSPSSSFLKRLTFRLMNASINGVITSIKRRTAKPLSSEIKSIQELDLSSDNNNLFETLQTLFQIYTTDNLKTVSAEAFQAHIQSLLNQQDYASEGYSEEELAQQRDLSIKYTWGHNHNFGSFRIDGRMGDRHLRLMANFIKLFPIELKELNNANVLDVGCWTGGTSLLLNALGAKVTALEEVNKYAKTAQYLADAFGLDDQINVNSLSIYECDNKSEWFDQFDLVYYPGVIYHVSDPVVSLRILFNTLKTGGKILVETAGIDSSEPLCRFDGNYVYNLGKKEQMNRGGWNWYLPSASALERMLWEAGFENVQSIWHPEEKRVFAYAEKVNQTPICRAGLAFKDIR